MIDHSNRILQNRIDLNAIANEETVLLKIPMSLPYPVANDYQFIKGKFEHHGEYFELVKQKLNGDTLYVVCIKDKRAKQINAKMIEYGNLSCEVSLETKGSKLLLSKIIQDYAPQSKLATIHQSGWVLETPDRELRISFYQIVHSIQSPPPKFG